MKTSIILIIVYFLISFEIKAQIVTIETTLDTPCASLKIPTATIDNYIIYPNPVREKLFIDIKAHSKQNSSIKIYDVKGSLVLKKNHLPEEGFIYLNKLKSGFYFLIFEKNKKIITKKLVIQK